MLIVLFGHAELIGLVIDLDIGFFLISFTSWDFYIMWLFMF